MVRLVGRSKGCESCRKRRIKCDEISPQCSQCVLSSIRCPGAIVGNVFINVSDDFQEKYSKCTRIRKKRSNRKPKSMDFIKTNDLPKILTPDTEDTPSSQLRSTNQQSPDASPSREIVQCQMLSQPSTAFALKEQLVGNFIHSLLGSPGGPMMKRWMLELPYLMLQENLPTLRYAIYASSMALYSNMEEDAVIQREACKWYIMGLRSEQKQLATHMAVTDGTLCAPMLLSFYEMIRSTSAYNWMNHMTATARLLQLRGVEGFDTDFAHRLFCSVRLAMIYISTALQKPSFLASDIWLTRPFLKYPKSQFDELVDILTIIPGYLSMVSKEKSSGGLDSPSVCLHLRNRLLALSAALQEWKETDQMGLYPNEWDHLSTRRIMHEHSSTYARTIGVISSPYHDPFKVEVSALYDSGCILVAKALQEISESYLSATYEDAIISSSASILASVAYIDCKTAWRNAGGPFRLVHPLQVVAQSSPSAQQTSYARDILSRWGESWGLSGMCMLTT